MANQVELDCCYIKVAEAHARLSRAERKRVGACLVTQSGVIIPGYNGTPSGTDNACEDEVDGALVTKPEVIHAELNCILKAAKEGVSVVGSKLYVTLSPCLPCSAMLKQAGVSEIVYLEGYRDSSGIDYLRSHGVKVRKF